MLRRRLENLPLSRCQAQLCLLMASGLSYAAIAKHLGIAKSTVIDHTRHLYGKLDVRNCAGLINKLLTVSR
jgi:DNA-binding CsgD family transcriptional regulator